MEVFEWDPKKSEWLKKHRGVSFEEVVEAIEKGGLLRILRHKNPHKYPDQIMLIVNIKNYPWVVPCEIREDKLRLATVYPCRKYKKLLEETHGGN